MYVYIFVLVCRCFGYRLSKNLKLAYGRAFEFELDQSQRKWVAKRNGKLMNASRKLALTCVDFCESVWPGLKFAMLKIKVSSFIAEISRTVMEYLNLKFAICTPHRTPGATAPRCCYKRSSHREKRYIYCLKHLKKQLGGFFDGPPA